MKLEEKFNGIVYPYLGSGMLVNEINQSVIDVNSKLCAEISCEFAIGFADWMLINYPNQYKFYKHNDKRGFYTTEKLLEIYKSIIK